MKKYEKPEIEIIKFRTEDILAASGIGTGVKNADIDGKSVDFPQTWSVE